MVSLRRFSEGGAVPRGQVVSVNTYYGRQLSPEDLERQSYGQVISANVLIEGTSNEVTVSQRSFADANDWFNLRFGTTLTFDLLGTMPIRARIDYPVWTPPAQQGSGMEEAVMDDSGGPSEPGEAVMSDYDSDSSGYESEQEFKRLGGRSKNVFSTYSGGKHQPHDAINTSSGLNQAVRRFDTGKNSSANTNLLYQGPEEETYTLYQKGTALGVGLYAQRFRKRTTGVRIQLAPTNAQATWGKDKNVHTEMHLLWLLTQGRREDVAGVMDGGRLVVDKPICRDCIQWVRLAAPDVIRDRHEGSDEERERWARWTNPFDLTPKKRPTFP
jgi:hypothetical protein